MRKMTALVLVFIAPQAGLIRGKRIHINFDRHRTTQGFHTHYHTPCVFSTYNNSPKEGQRTVIDYDSLTDVNVRPGDDRPPRGNESLYGRDFLVMYRDWFLP
jgi:hypothetical protein